MLTSVAGREDIIRQDEHRGTHKNENNIIWN